MSGLSDLAEMLGREYLRIYYFHRRQSNGQCTQGCNLVPGEHFIQHVWAHFSSEWLLGSLRSAQIDGETREHANLYPALQQARGNSPAGFWSQREWEDWSNFLINYIDEDDAARFSNPEGAQESIIEDCLAAYARMARAFEKITEEQENWRRLQRFGEAKSHRASYDIVKDARRASRKHKPRHREGDA